MWRQARSLFADSALTRSLPSRTTLLLRPTLNTTPVSSACRRFDRLLATAAMEKGTGTGQHSPPPRNTPFFTRAAIDEHNLPSKAKTSKKRVGMHVSTKYAPNPKLKSETWFVSQHMTDQGPMSEAGCRASLSVQLN